MATGRFPELPSVTPAGPTQPGTSTATAILPRPRPCRPRPLLPLRPRPAWPRPVRTLRPDVTVPPPPPAPPPVRVASGTRWFVARARSPCTARSRPVRPGRWGGRRPSGHPDLVSLEWQVGGRGGTVGATPQAKPDPDSELERLPSAPLFLTVHLPGWQPSFREPSPAGRGDGSLLLSVSPDRSLMNSTLL